MNHLGTYFRCKATSLSEQFLEICFVHIYLGSLITVLYLLNHGTYRFLKSYLSKLKSIYKNYRMPVIVDLDNSSLLLHSHCGL